MTIMTDYAVFYGTYDNPGERFFLMTPSPTPTLAPRQPPYYRMTTPAHVIYQRSICLNASSTAIGVFWNWADQCRCQWQLCLFSWNHLCNLAALHGGVNWHPHCRCKVFGHFGGAYPLTGWRTPGFCETLTLTHSKPLPLCAGAGFHGCGYG